MYRFPLVTRLSRAVFEPPTVERSHRPHAHRVAPLRPAPDARPMTGVRKARRMPIDAVRSSTA